MNLVFALYVVYTLVVLRWVFAVKRIQKQSSGTLDSQMSISVIVVFRNERENLENLLTSLSNQNYPKEFVEYIFVNDHSEDGGELLLENISSIGKYSFRLLHLEEKSGKKSGIEIGVQSAVNKIVVTTDADCVMGKNWLSCIAKWFEKKDASLLIGPVKLKGKGTLFENLQVFEFSTLMGVTMATANKKNPILSNGANFSFLRKYFVEMNPYQSNYNVQTGDDIFVLHEFKKRKKLRDRIYFLNDVDALVTTAPKTSYRDFLQQRLRWASKSKNYTDINTLFVGILIFGINITLIAVFIFSVLGYFPFLFFVFLFFLKWLLDLIFIQRVPLWLRGGNLFSFSLLLSLIYPVYSIGIALLSLFYKPKWKGRKI